MKRLIIALISIILLIASGYLIFTQDLNTIFKQAFCGFLMAAGLGGLYSCLDGTAEVTLGKWARVTGAAAVALIILFLVLRATGLLSDPADAASLASNWVAMFIANLEATA